MHHNADSFYSVDTQKPTLSVDLILMQSLELPQKVTRTDSKCILFAPRSNLSMHVCLC